MVKGTLYIVGTPIGNLEDITLRALNTLKKVDLILAEDTRNTLKLLNHFEIEKKMISYHRHNEQEKISQVLSYLDTGKDLALVSDAGMPIISDPGQNLIYYLVHNHYSVEVIPGVTAFVTAIVKSGMDSTRFTFEGFLSVHKPKRMKRLKELKEETRTMIFYEAPHKLLETLKNMYQAWGNRNICIARELTKLHEEFSYTTLEQAIEKISLEGIRGEIVLIVQGRDEKELEQEKVQAFQEKDVKELVKSYMQEGMDKKEAIKLVAKQRGVTKNEVYQECISL